MRYNRKSPRKKRWDYTKPGNYFITICTKDRKHFFGEIQNQKIILNGLGKYAYYCRQQISTHYPFVKPDEFVCMPNHIHGILFIGERGIASPGTYKNTSLEKGIQPKSGSLGAIIRGFKIGVTKYAKQLNTPFKRQPRYHDLLVRNSRDYKNFKTYIINNPKNRKQDTFS